jgi:hypothetical protein
MFLAMSLQQQTLVKDLYVVPSIILPLIMELKYSIS